MAKFEIGHTPMGGRPKGSKNKNTIGTYEVLQCCLRWMTDDNRLETLMAEVAETKPELLLAFILKLAPKDHGEAPLIEIQENKVLNNMIEIRKELQTKAEQTKKD